MKINLLKTADPTIVPVPGAAVVFRFVVTNESTAAPVTIDTLVDTVFGDLNARGSCRLPQVLAPQESYACEIEEEVSGSAGEIHTNTVEATAVDNRTGLVVRGTNSANVRIVDPVSPDVNVPGVTTHWVYWSESCKHLVDVWICLTLNDTVVVDPRAVSAVDLYNENVGPLTNLDGERGFVVVTAYHTGPLCRDGSVSGFTPIDGAIVGAATRANTEIGYSFGNDAIGLGLGPTQTSWSTREDPFTSFTRPSNSLVMPFDVSSPEWMSFFVVSNLAGTSLPDEADPGSGYTELPRGTSADINLLTLNPTSLNASSVVFLSLAEKSGSGDTAKIEVGPNPSNLSASVTAYDNLEIATSLPDYELRCADFTTILPGERGSLIPGSVALDSSATVRIRGINDTPGRFVYAIHGQAVGSYGGSNYGKYSMIPSFQ